jgi:lipid A ethanolaminephosphotransferase
MAALLWFAFQDLASTMRNHKSLRYTINPFNTVYALTRVAVGRADQAQQPLQAIGLDSALRHQPASPDLAPLIVLVVGETARAANFGLAGYARDTTPELQKLQKQGEVVYYPQVTSCGTNTQVSVPCMFSHLGRVEHTSTNNRYETALDVLQRAGLAVLWLDNQSGCKGVCDRVPHTDTRALTHAEHCTGGECLDKVMLAELPHQLAQLDAQRRAQGTVVVLHQMGNHGPAYYKRSPANQKPFQPECTTNVLQDCAPAHIVNAYDNAIRYTDSFLSDTIAWLKTQNRPTALVYVSDHGESLGEKGLYLHGMPFSMAPQEQTHVPMVTWLGGAWKGAMGCVRQRSEQALTHDHYFHTVLGLAGVHSREYQPAMDLLGPCVHPGN